MRTRIEMIKSMIADGMETLKHIDSKEKNFFGEVDSNENVVNTANKYFQTALKWLDKTDEEWNATEYKGQ